MTTILSASDLISALTDAGIPNLDTLMAVRTGSTAAPEVRHQHKEWRVAGAAATAPTAGTWTSLWQFDGFPSGGAVPTTWANPTNATAGGLRQANAGGGRTKYLTYGCANISTAGLLLVYDRLGHMGGMDATLTTAQNANGGSPGTVTRYTSGAFNFLAAEINTAIGATGTTITASYTNQAGTAGQVTQPVDLGGATHQAIGQLIMMPLATGDKGVQAVTSATVLATTGTAGNFGLVIGHPLFAIPISSSGFAYACCFEDQPLAKILANACLALAFLCGPSVATMVEAGFEMVEN